jgi:hypothetical protein
LRYRRWEFAMLLDEGASHTAKGSIDLAEVPGIELRWLPRRAPSLNPIEVLWCDGNDMACADYQGDSISEQVRR